MKSTILILLAVLTLIAAGCDAEDQPTEDTTAPAPGETVHEPPEEQAPDGGTQTGDAPEGDDVSSSFEALFSQRDTLEYTVTFDVTSTGPGMPADMTMTQYFGGADRFRTDSSIDGIESSGFFIDGEFTICTQVLEDWMCFESGNVEGTIQEVDDLLETGDYHVQAMPPRSVAGVNAQCFMLTMQEESQVEYCFSPEGVPLYIESGTELAVMSWTASEYSLSVPSDAWDIPESTGLPEGFDPDMFT